MNSSLRWKCRCMGKTAFLAILLGFPGAVSLPLASCRVLQAQEELELRPLRGPAGAKRNPNQRAAGEIADKVTPEVSQLIRKVLAGRDVEQKAAEKLVFSTEFQDTVVTERDLDSDPGMNVIPMFLKRPT